MTKPVFVHVEKTGGASLSEYFGGHKPVDPNACVDVTNYGQHFRRLKGVLKSSEDRAIIVLRNPADRAVSAYGWKRQKAGRDYDKDLQKVISEGIKSTAPKMQFTMSDAVHLSAKQMRLTPYKFYWDGLDIDDDRVTVLCTENLEDDVRTKVIPMCDIEPTQTFPVIHKTRHDETTIDKSLRDTLYSMYKDDFDIYNKFCGKN